MQSEAKFYHNLGANVIPAVGKKARILESWKRYATERQTSVDSIEGWVWSNGKYNYSGWDDRRVTGLAVVNGINDYRSIDFDDVTDVEIIYKALDLLQLPRDYPWLVKSGSGTGYHIWIRAAYELPRPFHDDGVINLPPLNGGFDHIEVRWSGNLTAVPPAKHNDTGYLYRFVNDDPVDAPAYVTAEALWEMLNGICDLEAAIQHKLNDVVKPITELEKPENRTHILQMKEWVNEHYLELAEQYLGYDEVTYEKGGTKLGGNGGLFYDDSCGVWYRFDSDIGGDAIDFYDYCRNPNGWNRETARNGRFMETLRELSKVSGVALPETNQVVVAKKGKVAMATEALARLGYTFRLNILTDKEECNGKPLTNAFESHILRDLDRYGIDSLQHIRTAMTATAADNPYHPVQEYLQSIKWDGNDHITKLASYFEDASGKGIVYLWLKRWLVGAVAKVFDGKQNMMLVIEGPQGCGKSNFARWLCSGLPDYFTEGAIRPNDNDDLVRLIENWIWEVAELGATTRRQDVEAIKDFITKGKVTVRKPYDRYNITKPAMASLIGTVNSDGAGFLTDTTGNRRFMIMPINRIDFAYTSLDINQIWAQALALYQAGEPSQPTTEERAIQEAINDEYQTDDPVENAIFMHYVIDKENGKFVPSAEIARKLETYGVGSGKSLTMQISRALVKYGAKKATVNNMRGFTGLREKSSGFGSGFKTR